MQIQLTDQNERLLNEAWKAADKRAKEQKLETPSVTKIANGILEETLTRFVAHMKVTKAIHE